jgi:hypothetical protein
VRGPRRGGRAGRGFGRRADDRRGSRRACVGR